ncbi:Ltp family lipoprotein [Listeria booriae]|uniref:DUF4969 domain-containing protein n=1 Tax=Listeria booriae TaxID=1552123 RepID=A0A7X0ZSP6_9LIST|nr:Ltp family lipoprotein [Listeria booriae]MBC2309290.1 DUF4969 domain-containing protein [Listeria booriae]
MKKILALMGVLLVFSFGLVACGNEQAKGDTQAEKTPKVEEKKDIELTIDQSYIQSDDNGKVVIKGKVDPKASLSSEGKQIAVDSNGSFTYELSFKDDSESEIVATLRAIKEGYNDKDYDVTVYNNSKSYKEKVAKEEAAQKKEAEKIAKENALAAEKAAKEEAARKAEEDRIAQKEAAAEKEKERLGAEGESALIKAEAYGTTMNMSKAGIYDQLTSEYGEKFSKEAAQYAVDNIDIDYNANALAKAKDYQDMMSMAPEAIRDQLTSEYGEKFTQAEADYAIQHLND